MTKSAVHRTRLLVFIRLRVLVLMPQGTEKPDQVRFLKGAMKHKGGEWSIHAVG
jgi:hypothetical protein